MTLPPDEAADLDTPNPEVSPGIAALDVEGESEIRDEGDDGQLLDDPDQLADLVAEIKQRLSDVSARELELERRESELDERSRHLSAPAPSELEPAPEFDPPRAADADSHEHVRANIAAESADLRRRRSALARRIQSAREAIARQRSAVVQDHGAIEQAARSIADERAELDAIAAALAQTREALEQQEEELGRQRGELSVTADDLARRRTELLAESDRVQARAADLNRLATEIDARQAELDARGHELGERQAQLEARAAELERQRIEVARSEAAPSAEAEEITQRRAAVDKLYFQATEIEQRALARFEEAGKARQNLVAKTEELKEYRRRLETAQREILTERARLKADRETHALLEAELTRRREAFEIESLDLGRRVDQLAERETEHEEIRARHVAEIEQQRSSLRTETRRVAEQIKDRVGQIEQRRTKLRHHAAELARQRDELVEKARRLQVRSAEAERAIADLDGRRRQLDERAREVESSEADLRSSIEALDARDVQIEQRHTELQQAQDALRHQEVAIEERRKAAEKIYAQATEQEHRARTRFDEAAQLQTQLQSKEAELASASLSAELGREEVETERARLLVERDTLNFLHAEAQRTIKDGRPGMASAPAAELRPAPPVSGLPRFWWWRAAALASAAATAAWFGVQRFEIAEYRSSLGLSIQTQRVTADEAVAEHLREWIADGAAAARPEDAGLAAAWDAANGAGRVEIEPGSQGAGLRVSLRSGDAAAGARLLAAAGDAFVRHVAQMPPERFFSPRMFEWKQRRAGVEAELNEARTQVSGVEARLAGLEGFDSWNRARSDVEQTQGEFDRVARRLGEQRGSLTALRGQDTPRAETPPEQLDAAMAEDALYQEDLKELASIAREHRMTTALAMMMMVDPLKDVRTAFQSLNATIGEQRAMQPPEGVAAVLEDCAAKLDALDQRLAEGAMQWDDRRQMVERLSPADQVPDLVRFQGEGASAARELVADVKNAMETISVRVNGLTSKGDAGTREMVVASLLRGSISGVSERIDVLGQAAAATDLATNFKLETLDRQLRGLRTRSSDRRDAVRRDLEQAAVQTAQRAYDDQVRDLDEQVRELERRRDELTVAMGARVSDLRGLEEKMQQFRTLHAELRARQDSQARLEERLVELDKTKPEIPADVVTPGDASVIQTAGIQRDRHAWTAAAAAAGLMLLVCGLMIVGPRRKTVA